MSRPPRKMVYREPIHIRVFRRWYMQLTHGLNVRDVVGHLFAAECLSKRELEQVQAKCDNAGRISASEDLMSNVLLRNPDPDCFQHFVRALEETQQEYLAENLKKDYHDFLDYESDRIAREEEEREFVESRLNPEHNLFGPRNTTENRGYAAAQQIAQPRGLTMQVTGTPETTGLGAGNVPSAGPTAMAAANPTTRPHVLQTQGMEYPPDDDYLPQATKEVFVPCVTKSQLGIDYNNRLGRGHFGVVLQALYNGTTVAVKEVMLPVRNRRNKTQEEVHKEQINKEFQVSAYVRHTNVVMLIAYALERNSLFLVYEYVNGYNFHDVIFDDTVYPIYRLDRKEKFYLTIQIGQALAYLHECNPKVIHGDVKPANMLVTRDKTIAKLCDLGLSKLKDQNSLTTTGGNMGPGTPMYMAKEQLLDQSVTTTRTDIWSMGASFYEIFFEEEVWEVTETVRDIKNLLKADKKPKRVAEPVDGRVDIALLVEKCMQSDSHNRPTAVELLKELRHLERRYLDTLGMESGVETS